MLTAFVSPLLLAHVQLCTISLLVAIWSGYKVENLNTPFVFHKFLLADLYLLDVNAYKKGSLQIALQVQRNVMYCIVLYT